jgi:hypothetical protein
LIHFVSSEAYGASYSAEMGSSFDNKLMPTKEEVRGVLSMQSGAADANYGTTYHQLSKPKQCSSIPLTVMPSS